MEPLLLFSALLAPYTTSGSGIIQATPTTLVLHGDPSVNSQFIIDKSDFNGPFGRHAIYIEDFYGANSKTPGLGLGHQDYVDLLGFSTSATVHKVGGVSDGHGGAYQLYDIADSGQHYDIVLHSENGGSLVTGFDYYLS